MKNITKIIVALFTSVSLISSVSAGDLSVTGSAKATYNILKGGSIGNASKGIGIANDINFGASGELDNGMSWNYQIQMDPASGGNAAFDDSQLTITSGYGTLGIYVTEGGLDTDNSASQSVYGRPSDIGLATGMLDGPAISSFNNLQYHLPSGTLPFEGTFKAAYATGQDTTINSTDAAGTQQDGYGDTAEQYQVTAVPVEGLKVFADYYKESGASAGFVVQNFEAGSLAATYAYGPATFGISRTLRAPLILASSSTLTAINNNSAAGGNKDSAREYESNKMSAAYNVNDALSISYEVEKSSRELIAQTTENDISSKALQAAYTMGGMTLALSHGKTDNVGYTLNNDAEQTLFAVTMAF